MTFQNADHPRIDDGTFTDKAQSAPQVSLTAESAEDRLAAIYFASGYYSEDAARGTAQNYIAEAAEAGIDAEYLIEYVSVVDGMSSTAYTAPSAAELNRLGYTPDDLRKLLEFDGGSYSNATYEYLRAGATAERIETLTGLGFPAKSLALKAFASIDDDQVAASWIGAARTLPVKFVHNWEAARSLADAGITPELATEFGDSGIDSYTVAKHPHAFRPSEAADFSRESGLGPEHVGRYMSHNIEHAGTPDELISATKAKAFGPNFEAPDVAELLRAEVAPKVARSLRGAQKDMQVATIAKLAKAGVTSGSDFKAWRELTAPSMGSGVGSGRPSDINPFSRDNPDEIKRIITAHKTGTPIVSAENFRRHGVTEPANWKNLHKAGVTDLADYVVQLKGVGRANSRITVPGSVAIVADGIAAWHKAGGDAAGLRVAQRAGIQIDEAHAHVGKTPADLWAAGAENRAAVMAGEQEKLASGRWWGREAPGDWGYTEETFTS